MATTEELQFKQYLKIGTLLALVAVGIVLAVFIFQRLLPLLVLLLASVVITTGIDPLAARLQRFAMRHRWRLSRGLAVLLVLLVGLIIILAALSFLVVTAVNQAASFMQNEALQANLINWAQGMAERYHLNIDPASLLERLRAQSGQIAAYLWTTTVAIFGVVGGLFSTFIVIILSYFFTTFKDGITYTLLQFVPPAYQQRTREIGHQAAEKMGGWLRGQLILAGIILLLSALIMTVLGFPRYAILVGIIGGVGELIPMVGPYLAFFPALIIILLSGGDLLQVIGAVVLFGALSQLENYVLSPKIMERQVGLHPVTTIIAIFIGGSVLGILGALLAIPLSAAGRVILLEAIFPAIQNRPRAVIEANAPEAIQERAAKEADAQQHEDAGDENE